MCHPTSVNCGTVICSMLSSMRPTLLKSNVITSSTPGLNVAIAPCYLISPSQIPLTSRRNYRIHYERGSVKKGLGGQWRKSKRQLGPSNLADQPLKVEEPHYPQTDEQKNPMSAEIYKSKRASYEVRLHTLTLEPGFYKKVENPKAFFHVGKVGICLSVGSFMLIKAKVFATLSVKKFVRDDSQIDNPNLSKVMYGENAYSEIYKFVVLEEIFRCNTCYCW